MPRRSTDRITDRYIKALDPPASGYKIYYDADLAGFGCRVHCGGGRAFVLNYLANKRERRIVIGDYPTWSSSAARERAKALKRDIDIGFDPLVQKSAAIGDAQAEHAAPTLADVFERYAKEHLPRKSARSAADDRSMWIKEILPRLGTVKVAVLRHEDVDALHASISQTRPVRANRVIEVLRKALNLALRWGWITLNPAAGASRNTEAKRERFLNIAEITRLQTAIALEPDRIAADALTLLMHTGARKSEALRATWEEFDLDAGIWIKPSAHTKQRKSHRLPLSEEVVELLKARSAQNTSQYVFPSRTGDKPLGDLRGAWERICIAAGFAELRQPIRKADGAVDLKSPAMLKPTLRIHDLRHTYASLLASSGYSLPIIGALLGHTQTQTTARYAHLLDDPLRDAVTSASGSLRGTNAKESAT